MRRALWFFVGLVYFALVWVSRPEIDLEMQVGAWAWLGLVIWCGVIFSACRLTWTDDSLFVSSPKVRRLAFSGLGAMVIQLTLGYLSHRLHAGLACPDFPACTEQFFPVGMEGWIAFSHRWWGIIMLGLFAHLALAAKKTAPELQVAARRAFALSVAQIFLGIGTVLSQLKPDSRLIHVAIGYALWGFLFYICVRTWKKPAPTGPRS